MKQIGQGLLYGADELIGMELEPIEWCCQNIVPRHGKVLIIGLAKTAKTLITTKLMIQASLGEPLLGFPSGKNVVLYIALERYQDFHQKLKDMSKGNLPNFYVLDHCDHPLFLDTTVAHGASEIILAINECGADIVVLDSKYKTTTKKESDEEATGNWIRNMDIITRDTGASIITIHHSPKQEYEELVNRAAGSSLLSRWADVIVGIKKLTRDKKDPFRVLEFVSNAGHEPDPITVKITDDGFEDVAEELMISKTVEAIDIISADIKRDSSIHITKRINKLAEITDIKERTYWYAWNIIRP